MAENKTAGSTNDGGCCCGPAANEHIVYRSVPETGKVPTPAGDIPAVSTAWSIGDHIGAVLMRLGFRRMDYAVSPGLYAVGNPGSGSPVLVSANYKLSFDVLRRELAGIDVWILVIDTKGVNVWCAAGKGTFGTMEIAKRVMATRLAEVVTARKLIVPQLGAPGVAAHMVQAFCDFSVVYGPVRARDIKQYLAAGMKADADMRRVTFGAADRLDVAWLELTLALKKGVALALAAFVIMGISGRGFSPAAAWAGSSAFVGLTVLGIVSGTLLTALLLPWLPGRAFSVKGGVLGAALAIGLQLVLYRALSLPAILFVAAVSAYLALNYTGCSTYTSLSGVKKEIRFALPVILGMLLLAGIAQAIGKVIS